MRDTTSWYEIRATVSLGDPYKEVKELSEIAYGASKQPGFAVLTTVETDLTEPTESYRLLYFSPIAASICKGRLTEFSIRESEFPAIVPTHDDPIELVCGDKDFAEGFLE